MRLRKQASWKDRVATTVTDRLTDTVGDAAWRKDIAEQATSAVRDAAVTVSENATTLAGKAGETLAEVKDEMSGSLDNLKPKRTGKGKKRVRRVLAVGAIGAAAQYFLDRRNGAARREKLRLRTNAAASAAATGFDKAASAAHSAADMTAEDDLPGQRRATPADNLQPN